MWTGLELLLVDGNNLLHRTSGGAQGAAARQLVTGLRARLPESITCIVVLDGPPDPGGPAREKYGARLEVRHAGRRDADAAIVEIVQQRQPHERSGIVVVTDDRALADRVRAAGGLTRRLDWLVAFLDRRPRPGAVLVGEPRVAPAIGRPGVPRPVRSPRPSPAGPTAADEGSTLEEDPRDPWRPGRGATRKRGPARRAPHRG